jgi:hypothetical protein
LAVAKLASGECRNKYATFQPNGEPTLRLAIYSPIMDATGRQITCLAIAVPKLSRRICVVHDLAEEADKTLPAERLLKLRKQRPIVGTVSARCVEGWNRASID